MTARLPERVAVVWVADWPVVAAGASPTEPAAVVFANRVVAVTAAARAEGVDVGLRRREAQARCSSLAVLEHDPARDARAFEPVVAAVVEHVTPRVEVVAAGQLAFPTRGPSRYHGGDAALAARTTELAVGALGVAPGPAVGVADGRFAALLAAIGARDAAIAGRSGPPSAPVAPTVVPPGGSAAFLAPFPVEALGLAGVAEELVEVLRRLGLRSLGAVAGLDVGEVAGRFGAEGSRAHRLASGADEHPSALSAPPADRTVRAELEPPVEQVETIAFVARGLADALVAGLDTDGLACTRLLIVAETEHGERLERRWLGDGSGGAATLTAGAIADRVRWQLDGWLRSGGDVATDAGDGRPTAGVTLLELVPEAVVPATGRQLGFWGGAAGAEERAIRAVARLAGLLGIGAVRVPEWRGGRAPAEQVALVPAVTVDLDADRPAARRPLDPAPWPGALPAPAPAAVLAAPVAAEVVAVDGAAVGVGRRGELGAVPARVRVGDGPWSDVAAWAGPWPVEERWWDPDRRRRRARLQVLDGAGVARLLTIEGGRWWVDAVYD